MNSKIRQLVQMIPVVFFERVENGSEYKKNCTVMKVNDVDGLRKKRNAL